MTLHFIAGFLAGAVVTVAALSVVAYLIDSASRKREEARRERRAKLSALVTTLDGVDVTHYLDREGRNGGVL